MDASEPIAEPAVEVAPPSRAPSRAGRAGRRLGGGLRFVARNAWLAVVIGAGFVALKVVDFDPPPEVRSGTADAARLVGDAPPQEFSHELTNPQAVQVRATLRLYSDNGLAVGAPDPATDPQGKILSQPVVTTIFGMNATVEQTIRLEDGDLEIDLALEATPRLGTRPDRNSPQPVVLEVQVDVTSRSQQWFGGKMRKRVHLASHAFLERVEEDGHRIVFAVDEQLFSVDLEVRRANAVAQGVMARTDPS